MNKRVMGLSLLAAAMALVACSDSAPSGAASTEGAGVTDASGWQHPRARSHHHTSRGVPRRPTHRVCDHDGWSGSTLGAVARFTDAAGACRRCGVAVLVS